MRSRWNWPALSRFAPAAPFFATAMAGLILGLLIAWCSERRLAKAPVSHVDRARELVASEVKDWGEPPAVHAEYLYALSCMNYVQNSVRPCRYTVFAKQDQFPCNADAETCFRLNAGICGNQVQAFHELLSSFQMPILHRSVEFYLHDEERGQNRNHVVAEVYYGGGWHMFDITAGAVFLRRESKRQDDLLSADELRVMAREHQPWQDLAVYNAASSWCRLQAHCHVDIFEYLTWPQTDILHGRTGAITLHRDAPSRRYALDGMYRTVGYTRDYNGNIGNASLHLNRSDMNDGPGKRLELTVCSFRPGANSVLRVMGGDTLIHEIPITKDIKVGQVLAVPITNVNGKLTLQLESADADAHLEFSEINLR